MKSRTPKGRRIRAVVLLLVFCVPVLALVLSNLFVTVTVTDEPVGLPAPRACLLITDERSNEEIISVLEEDPALINEYEPDTLFSMRAPLVTAVVAERPQLAKYLITHGASVEQARETILAEKSVDSRYAERIYQTFLDRLERLASEAAAEQNGTESAPDDKH